MDLHAADDCDPVADKKKAWTHAAVCCRTTDSSLEGFGHASAPPSHPPPFPSRSGDLGWFDGAKGEEVYHDVMSQIGWDARNLNQSSASPRMTLTHPN